MKKIILMSLFILQTSNSFAGLCDGGSPPTYCASLFPDQEEVNALTTQSTAVTDFVGSLTEANGREKADRSLFDFSGNDFTPYYLEAPTGTQLEQLKASLGGGSSKEYKAAIKAIEGQKTAVAKAFRKLYEFEPTSDEYTIDQVRRMDEAKKAYEEDKDDPKARKELLDAMTEMANEADHKERKQIIDRIEKLKIASDKMKTALESISTEIQSKADTLSADGKKRQEQIARVYAGATDKDKSEVERAGLLNQLIMLKADLISDQQDGVKAKLHQALEKSILGAFIKKKIDSLAGGKECKEAKDAQKVYLSLAKSAKQIACEETGQAKKSACDKMVDDIAKMPKVDEAPAE